MILPIYDNLPTITIHYVDLVPPSESAMGPLKQLPSLLTGLRDNINDAAAPDSEDQCIPACSTYTDCSSCTTSQSHIISSPNRCMWCQSMSQCIDQNAYLAEFVYGECRQWVTSRSMCQGQCWPSFFVSVFTYGRSCCVILSSFCLNRRQSDVSQYYVKSLRNL